MQTIDTLEALVPLLAGITKRDAFCKVILDNVPAKLKTPLGRAARDFYGHKWTDGSLAVGLSPSIHNGTHKAASVTWLAVPENKKRRQEAVNSWKTENLAHSASYYRDRRAKEPAFKTANLLRNRLRTAVKNGGAGKSASTMKLTGCTLPELMAHLESQFQPGMTWANQGEWEIDHIRPCASFDLTDPEQQRQCFHWTNLAPLWAADNRAKSDRLDWSPSARTEPDWSPEP